MKLIVRLIILTGLPLLASAQPATQPTAVWYQPPSLFQTWRARGVTILLGCTSPAEGVDVNGWCKQAAAAGFDYILQTDGTCDAHFADPHCIAVVTKDEPNNAGGQTPEQVFAAVRAIKLKTTKPVLINLDAWATQYQKDDVVWAYCAAADWVAADFHVVNHGDGIGALPVYVAQLQRYKRLAPGRKVWAFAETSDQNLRVQPWAQQPYDNTGKPWALRMRGPTVSEFLQEVKAAWAEGCPVCYFPDVIGLNWEKFDGTTPEIHGAMQALSH